MSALHTPGPVNCTRDYKSYLYTQENPSNVCLDTEAVVGLAFQAAAGLVSLVALLYLLGIICRNYRRNLNNPPPGPWRLFRGNIDVLMLNLIFADIWMSIGSIPNIYWARKGQVYSGPMCNTQGAIQTIGETAAAFATILVTVYTFVVVYLNRRPTYRPWYCLAAITATWLWVVLWGVVPIGTYSGLEPDEHGARLYYTPTPWWCWINGRYMPNRIVAEYLWLWIAGVGNICLYVPSYIILRKNKKEPSTTRKAEQGDQPSDRRSHSSSSSSSDQESPNPAEILYYPIAYTLCLLPLSIMRWAAFSDPSLLSNPRMNPPSMVFGVTFYLMGLINMVLTIRVRPLILLISSDGRLSPDDPRFIAETQAEAPDIIQMQRVGQTGGPDPNGQRVTASSLAGWNT